MHLTLELAADGDEPVGSLGRSGTGAGQPFWGWLELIEAIQECIHQLRPTANTEGASS